MTRSARMTTSLKQRASRAQADYGGRAGDRTGDLQLEILNLPGRRESRVSQEGLIKP
jgi:hypothetical protein